MQAICCNPLFGDGKSHHALAIEVVCRSVRKQSKGMKRRVAASCLDGKEGGIFSLYSFAHWRVCRIFANIL